MPVPLPDPVETRQWCLGELTRWGLPLPPEGFPLVWEPGDEVSLRTASELEARAAILHVVLARAFGMAVEPATKWLLEARLMDQVTPPEWEYIATGEGDYRVFALHLEAMYALAWLIGIGPDLDPLQPAAPGLIEKMPNLPAGEAYKQWRSRTLVAVQDPVEVAAILDLYYCLDWAYQEAEKQKLLLPGLIDSNAIGQRRWALEWAVVFHGPYHDPPGGWEEVDLST